MLLVAPVHLRRTERACQLKRDYKRTLAAVSCRFRQPVAVIAQAIVERRARIASSLPRTLSGVVRSGSLELGL